MHKLLLYCAIISLSISSCTNNANSTAPASTPAAAEQAGIYGFKVTALDGGTIDFADYKGKKILVVNTASECGYTYQYEGLEALYQKYKDKLVIVGFPANDFGLQEPGTNEEIADFCKDNFGVTFPMAAKISVVGDDMAPIYRWLTTKDQNGYDNSTIQWNFQKYLVNENGELAGIFESKTEPGDPKIIAAIEK